MSSSARPITVTCDCCRGTGQRDLTYTEQVTLDAVTSATWSTTREIQTRLGNHVKNPALCNRLVELLALQLVERRECRTNHRMLEWRRVR